MKYSESSKEVIAALVKAQSEFNPVVLDAFNPHFKSAYASFTSVWNAVKDSLSKNGLAISLPLGKSDIGITVTPVLFHKSGEWIEGDAAVFPVTRADSQGVASATTYAKRIALAAFLSLSVDTDDDGNAASSGGKKASPVEVAQRVAAKKGAADELFG